MLNANDAAATDRLTGRTAAKILFAQIVKGRDDMTDDLVQRLRGDLPDKKVESHWITDYTAVEMQNREAADRIEAQAAEIERLREAVNDLLTRFDAWSPHDHDAVKNAKKALGETE